MFTLHSLKFLISYLSSFFVTSELIICTFLDDIDEFSSPELLELVIPSSKVNLAATP